SAGRPRRLLGQVFAVAAVTTAVLSLDATVVLLTPVVFATVARLEVRAKPHVYACTHLANSASLLLPVSHLTNLLPVAATGLAFGRCAALMVLPWLAAIAVEYLIFRRFFAADLDGPASTRPCGSSRPGPASPCCTSSPRTWRRPRTAPTWDCSAAGSPAAIQAHASRSLPPRQPPTCSMPPHAGSAAPASG